MSEQMIRVVVVTNPTGMSGTATCSCGAMFCWDAELGANAEVVEPPPGVSEHVVIACPCCRTKL